MNIKNDGNVLVWFLIIMGTSALVIYAAATWTSTGSSFVYGGALALLICGFGFEARHDLYIFAQVFSIISFIIGIIAGAIVFTGQEISIVALVLFIVAVIGFIFCIVVLGRAHFGTDDLPNFLEGFADWSDVSEINGIQLVTSQSGNLLRSTSDFVLIEIYVQNTWNTDREISFTLNSERRVSLNRAGLIYDESARISLGPAEVGKVSIRVIAHPDAKGRYSLVFAPKVMGRGGRRVRIKRATTFSPPTHPLVIFFGLFAGFLTFGGGIKFPIKVQHLASTPLNAPPPMEAQIIWTMLNDDTGQLSQ